MHITMLASSSKFPQNNLLRLSGKTIQWQPILYAFNTSITVLGILVHACCLFSKKVADSLRSHGLPVRLVSFMENTPHGIRRTLSKLRRMKEIRSESHFGLMFMALILIPAFLFNFAV